MDTDFMHAAHGFPMLLRNAHSFAVRLCKCSEHNTGGLLCLTGPLCIKHQCCSSAEIMRGGLKGVTNERTVSELGSN